MSMRIEVDGVGTVEVDPSFAELSPEEQNGVIEEIRQSASSGRASSDAVAPSAMSINAGRQDFDIEAEIDRAQPPQTAMPNQTEQPQEFGFNFEQSQPLLLRFVNQLEARDRKIKTAKFGDAAVPGTKGNIESSFEQVFNQEFAPAFQQVGLDPEIVQEFGRIKQADPKLTVPEALQRAGVALPSSGASAVSSPETVEMLRGKQQARDAEYAAADNAPDEVTKGRHLERAMQIDSEIDGLRGVSEMPFQEKELELELAKNNYKNLELRKDGTVSLRGQNFGYPDRDALAAEISRQEANLDMEAMRKITDLPISRRTPGLLVEEGVDENGQPIINKDETAKNFAAMTAQMVKDGKLREGQRYQDPFTGDIARWGGLAPVGPNERSFSDRWSSDLPAIRGAREMVGQAMDAAAPMVSKTVENAGKAIDTLTRIPRENLKSLPAFWLARKGLDYLSEVGRKAEEEEKKKKLAGQ